MNMLTHLPPEDLPHHDVMLNPHDVITPLMTSSPHLPMSRDMAPDYSTPEEGGSGGDERVVQAILISHNGPQSFQQPGRDGQQHVGSPYVKITEKDGKFDSWVVLPLQEFQQIYQNNINLVRRHLFGTPFTKQEPNTGVFPCEDCGYVYNKEYNLKRHRKEKHAIIVKRVKCPYCGKFYIREDNLVRHVRNVHNQEERCVCIHCGAGFYRHASLKRHILTKHKESKQHKCSLCAKSFSFKWELKIHHQNHHTSQPGYTCELCSKTYKRPQTLAEHKKFYHEGYRVICKIDNCNELFNTMANFKRHKSQMHVTGDTMMKRGPSHSEERYKSYQIVPVESLGEVRCCECGVPCHGRGELQKHYKKEHFTENKTRKTADLLYKCNQCATTFKEKESYENHAIKFHSHTSTLDLNVDFPFNKGPISCCDGVCDNTGLDLSVTSQLMAIQDTEPGSSNQFTN